MKIFSLFKVLTKGKSYWRGKNQATVAIISAFFILVIGIAVAEYLGFSHLLRTLNQTPEFKDVVISYSFHSIFAILFSLIIASALITTCFSK